MKKNLGKYLYNLQILFNLKSSIGSDKYTLGILVMAWFWTGSIASNQVAQFVAAFVFGGYGFEPSLAVYISALTTYTLTLIQGFTMVGQLWVNKVILHLHAGIN